MQRNKSIIGLFAMLIIILSVVSCGPSGPSGKIKFASLRYDSTVIANWMAEGKKTKRFFFQFYTPQVEKPKESFQLVSYVLDSAGAYSNGASPDTLAIVTDSIPKIFTDKAVLGNNELSRRKIELLITNPAGTRISFDYLLFVPKLLKSNNHVVYDIKIIKDKKVVPAAMPGVQSGDEETKPSPPAPPEDL